MELEDVSANAERAAREIEVRALVLHLDQLGKESPHAGAVSDFDVGEHVVVRLGRAQPVNAGDRGDDDDVAPLEERLRCGKPQLVDLFVPGGLLLDVRVALRDVRLRLVVVVVRHEVLDRVLRKEAVELLVELGGQRLVVGQDEGRAVDRLDHLRHRERLSGAGDTEQRLGLLALPEALDELFDGLRLVAGWAEVGDDVEVCHRAYTRHASSGTRSEVATTAATMASLRRRRRAMISAMAGCRGMASHYARRTDTPCPSCRSPGRGSRRRR